MEIIKNATVTNWDSTWTYRPAVIAKPSSVDEIIEILSDTGRFPSPVCPAGSRHSTARMNGDDGGTIVDMTGMNEILEIGDGFVRVQAGAEHIEVSRALRRKGLQLHITTEIGNCTFAAMACAASKDASFPGEYGQINSYVTGVKLVAPSGEVRELSVGTDAGEMRLLRSSYGLVGIIFEVTIRCMPTQAIAVHHVDVSLDEFKKNLPSWESEGYSIMYYIFPYARRIVVELRRFNPDVKPKARRIWSYRNRFWRKYGPAIAVRIKKLTTNQKLRDGLLDLNDYLLRKAAVLFIRSSRTWPHAQTINYPRDPGPKKYIFSMWAFNETKYFEILERYFEFCDSYRRKTGYRTDLSHVGYRISQDDSSLLSYSQSGMAMSIDPASTGGPDWEKFLQAYNEFCCKEGGTPLFNQTPFLTMEQARTAFGARLDELETYRRKWDPKGRLLDSQFKAFLQKA